MLFESLTFEFVHVWRQFCTFRMIPANTFCDSNCKWMGWRFDRDKRLQIWCQFCDKNNPPKNGYTKQLKTQTIFGCVKSFVQPIEHNIWTLYAFSLRPCNVWRQLHHVYSLYKRASKNVNSRYQPPMKCLQLIHHYDRLQYSYTSLPRNLCVSIQSNNVKIIVWCDRAILWRKQIIRYEFTIPNSRQLSAYSWLHLKHLHMQQRNQSIWTYS